MTAKVIFKVYGNEVLAIEAPKMIQEETKKKESTVSSQSSTPTTTPRDKTPEKKIDREVEVIEKK